MSPTGEMLWMDGCALIVPPTRQRLFSRALMEQAGSFTTTRSHQGGTTDRASWPECARPPISLVDSVAS